jgi:hypothetical protein
VEFTGWIFDDVLQLIATKIEACLRIVSMESFVQLYFFSLE